MRLRQTQHPSSRLDHRSGSHSSQRMCQQYLQVPTRTRHRQQVNHNPFEHSLHSLCPHKGHLKLCSIAVSLFGRDGQFTDALKITLVTWTVRQAYRIEDPASIGRPTDQGGFASAFCPWLRARHLQRSPDIRVIEP
jgi:hypothetical protein